MNMLQVQCNSFLKKANHPENRNIYFWYLI